MTQKDLDFQAVVSEFIRAHAPRQGGAELWQKDDWLQALVEKGWQAPSWPRELGGAGFTATEKYLWYRTCHAEIEQFAEPPALEIVGPILGRLAAPSLCQRFLPPILEFRHRWCVALQTEDAPVIKFHAERGVLSGQVQWVQRAEHSDFVLALGQLSGSQLQNEASERWCLFACPTAARGLSMTAVQTLAGETLHHIEFDGVELHPEDLVCRFDDLAMVNLPGYQLGQSAVIDVQLQLLDEQLRTLSDAGDLIYRRQEVAIALAGLKAMELRYVDALQRDVTLPFSLAALALRKAVITGKVGALLMDSFGYYALPYPDMWLQHNMETVGPIGARGATQGWLQHTVSENYASVSQDLYGKLASEQQDTGEQ